MNAKNDAKEFTDKELQDLFGVVYYEPGEKAIFESPPNHQYYFKAYIGKHIIDVDYGDSVYYISANNKAERSKDLNAWEPNVAHVKSGPVQVESNYFAIVMRGYMPDDRSATFGKTTELPYVNGCSTKQIFSPVRIGDPTLQYLKIPAFSAEQAHHIHSTVRVVYVLRGKGVSLVGMDDKVAEEDLYTGKVCILHPMCPHHFETPYGDSVEVIPFHVFSSVGGAENNHPMFNGTYLMNQGE